MLRIHLLRINFKFFQENVFLYPGSNMNAYKQCSNYPDVSLKMWMSCCDQSCSAGLSSLADNSLRKRRSHNIYSSIEKPIKVCISHNGKKHDEGELWSEGRCQNCECRRGKIWCTVDHDCAQTEK